MELSVFHEKNDNLDRLINAYFDHRLTPKNNSNHKIFKTHLYDGVSGLMMFIVKDNEIIATFGAIVTEIDKSTKAIKMPHRLHIRSDYTSFHNTFIDSWFEPRLYQWIQTTGIKNLYQTMNEGNEKAMWLSSLRHNRRRKYAINKVNQIGQQFIASEWKMLPYLVYEKYTWQYAYWTSLEDIQWNKDWKQTKQIDNDIKIKLDSKLKKDVNGCWLL